MSAASQGSARVFFAYKVLFEKYNSLSFVEIINGNYVSGVRLQELGHILITSISQNIYILNLIYSALFTLPLFYFCSKFTIYLHNYFFIMN